MTLSTRAHVRLFLAAWWLGAVACAPPPAADSARASGHVEATDVRIASPVGGRILELRVAEGDRVEPGAIVATLDTADTELALARARAEREQAEAQLRLLEAGARPQDIRQAEAQVAAARADVEAADAELAAAAIDAERFETLLASGSGARKPRDDAAARLNVARARVQGARDRVRAADENVARLRAGTRPEEIAAARARVAAANAQIATLLKAMDDAVVTAPLAGVVTERLADPGELVPPRAPLVVITDLDRAWANVYVDEPDVPRLRVGQPATLFTDAGGPGIPGVVSYISPRAEFTPRNVQTAEDRSKLVYRIKVSANNEDGVLKVGMPVEAELRFVH
jgi:HlyD family secretion protein